MYQRFLTQPLLAALADTPVVLVAGARQAGKTTLVRSIARDAHPAQYITLDDATYLAAALSDPAAFVNGLASPVVIDEIQHAPDLLRAIKVQVDRDRIPGRFLLTGSANVMLIPRLAESLAGRMEILTLWPLSQAEIAGTSAGFVRSLFQEDFAVGRPSPESRSDLVGRIVRGGYPEPLARKSEGRRRAWYGSYITSILQRDVRDIADIAGLTVLPRLLSILASRAAGLLNLADVSRTANVPYTTLNRYMSLLQSTYLIWLLPAWSANLGTRLVKSPKVILGDTGLASSLIGVDEARLLSDPVLLGSLLENMVVTEVLKDIGYSGVDVGLYHYRASSGIEVDLLLEAANGQLVGIEVKASGTASPADFRGLKALQTALPDRFVRGVVLYTGSEAVPFGDRLHAVPVQALWQ